MLSLESQRDFQNLLCFVLLYNKSLQLVPWGTVNFVSLEMSLFPSTSSWRGNIEILGKQNSLFPSGPVIKC